MGIRKPPDSSDQVAKFHCFTVLLLKINAIVIPEQFSNLLCQCCPQDTEGKYMLKWNYLVCDIQG